MADFDTTSSGKSPAFQFYPSDFTTGTLTLTTEEVGAYILLMCHAWDKGSVPDDLRLLSRIARISPSRMERAWIALQPKFQKVNGAYIQPRLEREREKQLQWREKSAAGGRKSQAKRKGGSTTDEPPLQPIGQPNTDSSVFGLRSSSSDFSQDRKERGLPARGFGSGVMAGTLPRDHLNCRPPCERICLSQRQHAVLRSRYGGVSEELADEALDAFYADVRARLDPDIPIGDTPWKFWDAQFAARFGTVVGSANTKTAGNAAAAARFIARGQK